MSQLTKYTLVALLGCLLTLLISESFAGPFNKSRRNRSRQQESQCRPGDDCYNNTSSNNLRIGENLSIETPPGWSPPQTSNNYFPANQINPYAPVPLIRPVPTPVYITPTQVIQKPVKNRIVLVEETTGNIAEIEKELEVISNSIERRRLKILSLQVLEKELVQEHHERIASRKIEISERKKALSMESLNLDNELKRLEKKHSRSLLVK